MATTQFYFEKGIPAGIQRLVNPDPIQKLVVEKSNGLLTKWSQSLAKEADKIIKGESRGFFGFLKKNNPMLESGAVSLALYGNSRGYGLSAEDWEYLELLKSVRALDSFREKRYEGPKDLDLNQIREALESLVEDTKSDIFPTMLKDFSRVSKSVSPEIERHCLEVYGEDCVRGEGSEIFNGDLKKSVDIGVIRTNPPNGLRVWKAFLPLILS